MNYSMYKLKFSTGVHFGEGMLNDSAYTFKADSLFSALYIEAMKLECEKEFMDAVKGNRLIFSDAFPYVGEKYLIPKPMLYVENKNQGDSKVKKQFKKLKYIPISELDLYLSGNLNAQTNPVSNLGAAIRYAKVAVRGKKETEPYHVGAFYFQEGNGLYVILGYENEEDKYLFEDLMIALSYTGIGGKKSSGFGKFELNFGKLSNEFEQKLKSKSPNKMLLSVALPTESELESALEKSSYILEKRSGFVASDSYAEEQRRKRDMYVMGAGSCFEHEFVGDVYDVANQGSHPVYRYAKALFMGV